MPDGVCQAIHVAGADAEVRVIVLKGAGCALCPGDDISGFKSDSPRQSDDRLPGEA
jgi:enoyl-CoA hydratase/carnithine racemase